MWYRYGVHALGVSLLFDTDIVLLQLGLSLSLSNYIHTSAEPVAHRANTHTALAASELARVKGRTSARLLRDVLASCAMYTIYVRAGSKAAQASAMVESDHKCTGTSTIDIVSTTLLISSTSIWAAQSSSRGSETCFKGATFVFDVRMVQRELTSSIAVRT
uniref:Uncharacterized protein n=1 Tax=Trichogramma kaykai TaxID=54128 RepID=A0ABD2W0H4_9HYME